jgi:hypothetical protein
MTAVATPKQIRELMKVDGLTNDEVKSHLQVSDPAAAHSPWHSIRPSQEVTNICCCDGR